MARQALLAARRRQSQPRLPGRPGRHADQPLAHFLENELFPRHDVVFDIHSGGTSMEHLPLRADRAPGRCRRASERAVALMRALGMPYGFVADNGAAAPTSMGAAARAGVIGLSAASSAAAARRRRAIDGDHRGRAIDSLLLALGVIDAPVLGAGAASPAPMRLLSLARHSQGDLCHRAAAGSSRRSRLGDSVEAGQLAGWYARPRTAGGGGGAAAFRRGRHRDLAPAAHRCAKPGDCLMQVAEVLDSGRYRRGAKGGEGKG